MIQLPIEIPLAAIPSIIYFGFAAIFLLCAWHHDRIRRELFPEEFED